nr:MAG TPA: hypothetical protein [Caudoviricetes sp.]
MIRNNKSSPHPHSRFYWGFLEWAAKCQIVVQNQPTGFARLWADFFVERKPPAVPVVPKSFSYAQK